MATIYYDFSALTNGAGTAADPKKTFTNPSNGDVVRIKRGNVWISGQLNLSASGLTFEAWYNSDGSDDTTQPKPIITIQLAAGTSGINVTGTGIHTFRNIVFHSFRNTATGANVNGLTFGNTGTYGVDPGVSARVYDCEFYRIPGNAISFNGVNVVTDAGLAAPVALVTRCVFDQIGEDCVYGQGKLFEVSYCRMTRMSQTTITGDGVGFLYGNPTLAWIHHNYIDHSDTDYKHCIIVDGQNSTGFAIIEHNTLIAKGAVGVNLDECKGIIRKNKIITSDIGVSTNVDGNEIYSNLFIVNGFRADSSATIGLLTSSAKVNNNTFKTNFVSNTASLIESGSGRSGNVIQNNVVLGAGIFYKQGNGSTQTLRYNGFQNVTTPYVDNSLTPISNDATDIVGDLQLGVNYIPTNSSPLKNAGIYWSTHTDIQNNLRNNPPTIGAYNVTKVRGTR